MYKINLFILIFFAFSKGYSAPPVLHAIYGVYKNVSAPGSGPLISVRCEAPFKNVCLYQLKKVTDSSPVSCESIKSVPNIWGLDENKNYIGLVEENGSINFIEVVSSSIVECNSNFIEIQYF